MSEISEAIATKALRCTIDLGQSSLDVYMLPDGEKRFGVGGASSALGYTERWFYNRTKRPSKWLDDLQGSGFTGAQEEVSVIRKDEDGEIQRGASLSKTISLRDFVKLVTYEAIISRNLKAIILLAAFAETGLERILDDAFAGRSIEFILEKIVHYSQWTYEDFQKALEENREEVRALYSWGNWELAERRNPDRPR